MNCGGRDFSLSTLRLSPGLTSAYIVLRQMYSKSRSKVNSHCFFFQLTLICFVLWAHICVTQFHFPGRGNPPEPPPGLPYWQEDLVPPRKARTGNRGRMDLKLVVESHQLSWRGLQIWKDENAIRILITVPKVTLDNWTKCAVETSASELPCSSPHAGLVSAPVFSIAIPLP